MGLRACADCPCAVECSIGSWAKVDKYSYASRQDCERKIVAKLVNSGKHGILEEDARPHVANKTFIVVHSETFADREAYRTQIDLIEKKRPPGILPILDEVIVQQE